MRNLKNSSNKMKPKHGTQLRSPPTPTETNCKPRPFSSKLSQKGGAGNREVFTLYSRKHKQQNVYVYIVDMANKSNRTHRRIRFNFAWLLHHRMAIPKGTYQLSDISYLGERVPCPFKLRNHPKDDYKSL